MPYKVSMNPVIACSADNAYALPLAVMLRSLNDNAAKADRVDVYVLDGGISRSNRRRIERSVSDGKLNLHWIRPERASIVDMPVSGHLSLCAYFRMLIPDLLPLSETYALYLDVDLLVLGDISDLWNLRDTHRSLMACHHNRTLADCENRNTLFSGISNPENKKYFNSGVLGINLQKWRTSHMGDRIIRFIADNKPNVIWHDQDGLNAVLADDWVELPSIWNRRLYLTNLEASISDGCGSLKWNDVIRDTGILHFVSRVKPWHYGVIEPAVDLYFNYIDRTAWKGWRPKRPVLKIVLKRLTNKYTYGKLLRNTPVVGHVWRWLRDSV